MIEIIIDQLIRQRWATIDNLLPLATIEALRQEIFQIETTKQFHKAKIGQAAQQVTTIRSDATKWVKDDNPSIALRTYFNFLEQLRSTINCELQLGLFQHEVHYALYQPGDFYRRHVDQFSQNKSRQLSFILYLNPQWQTSEGGILSIYDTDEKFLTQVLPEANRFVCFFSDLPHEISTTQRQRLSITGWFKRRN